MRYVFCKSILDGRDVVGSTQTNNVRGFFTMFITTCSKQHLYVRCSFYMKKPMSIHQPQNET